jgi:hypothetical protein
MRLLDGCTVFALVAGKEAEFYLVGFEDRKPTEELELGGGANSDPWEGAPWTQKVFTRSETASAFPSLHFHFQLYRFFI